MYIKSSSRIRNVAIIAHIDHGKTTLLDSLLLQSSVFRENQLIPSRVMDSYDQEKERGITIFAKHCSIMFGEYKINIIDTPGHADFSGEVERILDMVNSVLLLIDAREGPMPQTRYVLSQALKKNLRPLVIINKIDRPYAEPDRVLNETFDLFTELSATDEQLDFSYIYASGLAGYACNDLNDNKSNLEPLLQLIIDKVPPPSGSDTEPFAMQAANVIYDDYLGRGACGRILNGTIRKGSLIAHIDKTSKKSNIRISNIKGYSGIQQVELSEAFAGDIVNIFGIQDVLIGDTLCDPEHILSLPPLKVEEPTVSINFMINSGPFVGQEGVHVTANKIRDRLLKEKQANITFQIEETNNQRDVIKVSGRGGLHLAVLIETMRREGYEFCISKPKVITRIIDGVTHEALERVYVEVPEKDSGVIIENLSKRKGEMQKLNINEYQIACMEFLVPTRGLMGFRHIFLTLTRGEGILTSIFEKFVPWIENVPCRKSGVMISMNQGRVTPYAYFNLQERGKMLVRANDYVYEGMIIGEHCRDNDIMVNITREKQLTNIRAAGKDENIILTPHIKMTLEQAIEYIEDDELIEVTPNNFRLRKFFLKECERKRQR